MDFATVAVSFSLVVIRVSDLRQSRRFYESLGLQLSVEQHGNGPEHLAVDLCGTVFERYPRGDLPASSGVRLGFRVPSVIAAVSALEQIGAEIVSPPTEGRWGVRAVIVDPDGHRVELSQ